MYLQHLLPCDVFNSGVRSRSPGAKEDKVHAFINFDALVFSRYVRNPTYDQIFTQIRSFERGKGKEKKKIGLHTPEGNLLLPTGTS